MTTREQNAKRTEKAQKDKVKAIAINGNKCACCGLQYDGKHRAIFDFHHINGNRDKDKNLSSMFGRTSWDNINKELAKCIMLCNNCHEMLHEDLGSNPTAYETITYVNNFKAMD